LLFRNRIINISWLFNQLLYREDRISPKTFSIKNCTTEAQAELGFLDAILLYDNIDLVETNSGSHSWLPKEKMYKILMDKKNAQFRIEFYKCLRDNVHYLKKESNKINKKIAIYSKMLKDFTDDEKLIGEVSE